MNLFSRVIKIDFITENQRSQYSEFIMMVMNSIVKYGV